jgi:hypothetical protein
MQLERRLPHLLLRADADPAQGAGHVMRCLALAESWHRESGQVTLLSSRLNPALRKRTETLGIDLAEIPIPHPDTSDLRSSFNALEKHHVTVPNCLGLSSMAIISTQPIKAFSAQQDAA